VGEGTVRGRGVKEKISPALRIQHRVERISMDKEEKEWKED
jgi:hypothetical protein